MIFTYTDATGEKTVIYRINKVECNIRANGVDVPQDVWQVIRSNDGGDTWEKIRGVYFTQAEANNALFDMVEANRNYK